MAIKPESTMASIAGVQAPVKTKIIRKTQIFDDGNNFQNFVANTELQDDDVEEVVRKRGNSWVVYDDDSDVEKGVYPKRTDAWKRQRMIRNANKAKKKNKHKNTVSKPIKTIKKEGMIKMLKENLLTLLQERSAMSYVFEQGPSSDDDTTWENFLQKLSSQAIMSDPKLKSILQNMAKSESKLLDLSVKAIADVLHKSGDGFEVEKGKLNRDDSGNVMMDFSVFMPESNIELGFAVKTENGRPLIFFPPQTKNQINTLANDESKLLRVLLMAAQETALDKMEDFSSATGKRNEYLRTIEAKLDKVLQSMSPLQMAMVRELLKVKYKSIK